MPIEVLLLLLWLQLRPIGLMGVGIVRLAVKCKEQIKPPLIYQYQSIHLYIYIYLATVFIQ